ncbi:MAG TPA: hypothetical protein VKB80_26470 [Kofleriaceae bacterium]|nr:hypothetical protein [Kofleriaceae bacterium]
MKGATRAAAVLVLALPVVAGCEDADHNPPGEGGGAPGGGSSGGGGAADAGTADGGSNSDGGSGLSGQLCNVVDLRRPLDCLPAGLSGITVRDLASNASATTSASGNFTLAVDVDSNLVLTVGVGQDATRDALVPIGMWGGLGLRAPRVAQSVWDDILTNDVGASETTGTATIAVYVVDLDGLSVSGAEVSTVSDDPVFYDDDSMQGWSGVAAATGPRGAALILSVPAATTADLVVTANGMTFNATVPVRADTLTWARVSTIGK